MLYNACLYGNYKQETKHKFINPQIGKYINFVSLLKIVYYIRSRNFAIPRSAIVPYNTQTDWHYCPHFAIRDIAQQHPNTTYIAHHQFHSHHHHQRARIPMCSLLYAILSIQIQNRSPKHTHTFNCTHVVFAGSEHVCVCVCVKPATFVYIIYM